MSLINAYYVLLFCALSVMLVQLCFRPVRVEHILTAIFSGSIAMVSLQVLTAQVGSPYHYVFALGTCATCNVIWLISRALFRGSDSLCIRHYALAASIALLVMTSRSLELLVSVNWLTDASIQWIKGAVSEITQLLSSTILALAFWEAVRGFNQANKISQYQRLLFAGSFFTGVFSCTVVAEGMLSSDISAQIRPWLVVSSALLITLVTCGIVLWQHLLRRQAIQLSPSKTATEFISEPAMAEEEQLFRQITLLMERERRFLQHDLKTIDIANALQVSEYKISRAIRVMSPAANVNQYINGHRVCYAKQLLTSKHSEQWTILVISLESGFASLAPFNRAFKASEGCTPNQYRQRYQNKAFTTRLPPINSQ